MASKIKVDTLETADGTGSITLNNQLSGMTTASLPTLTSAEMPTGSVLKVTQSGTIARTTITSTGVWTATGLSDVITPISTSSKILVMVTVAIRLTGSSASRGGIRLKRGSDVVWNTQPHTEMIQFNVGGENTQLVSMHYIDSPSTTSATTYNIEAYLAVGTQMLLWESSRGAVITLTEIQG
jgi:hypothetical protein